MHPKLTFILESIKINSTQNQVDQNNYQFLNHSAKIHPKLTAIFAKLLPIFELFIINTSEIDINFCQIIEQSIQNGQSIVINRFLKKSQV